MMSRNLTAAAIAAALGCLAAAAPARSGPARSDDGLAPVACASEHQLYALLDAADRNDAGAENRLAARNCESLEGRRYTVVAQKNGIVTIRLFPRDGDWAGSRLAVTLDEMVEPDLFPGSEAVPEPSS